MADLGNISKLKLPNGDVVHVKDDVSGYTTNTGTITGITMNGASKGTSGVVDLGTVITSHQDISGKADKSSTVSTVAWDSTNKKLTKTINGTTSDVVTIDTIKTALNLPDPMVFKGSLGTGGTITTLPTASSSNTGYTYKVITDGTYAEQAAKVGDTFISDGSAWVLIPSGDEPSGTVTSVAVSNGGGLSVSGSPITSSGTITIGHSNSVTAQTTQALYPIKIDAQGHISAYGSAVSVPTSAANNTTGISIADHSTTSIYGVKSGTNSTTTASKASGANGTAPSLTFAVDSTDSKQLNISWSAGSASTWSFTDVTVPIREDSATTVVTGKTHSITDTGHTHTLS